MTEPLQLLEERLADLRIMLDTAKKNDCSQEELTTFHNKYYVCTETIRRFVNKRRVI